MPDGRAPSSNWVRYTSLGVELGAAVALPTILGAWADRHWNSEPWGFLVGFCLGLAGGFYHFIRSSLAAMREAAAEDRKDLAAPPEPHLRPIQEERDENHEPER